MMSSDELSPSLSLYRTSVQSIQHCKECVGCATALGCGPSCFTITGTEQHNCTYVCECIYVCECVCECVSVCVSECVCTYTNL